MERRTIVVTRRLPGVPWDDLARRFQAGDPPTDGTMPREEFLSRARGAAGILCTLADRVDAELMNAAGSSLSVVSNFAVGVNNVDVAEATRRGIRVCNTPDVLTDATADLGFALLLSAARKVSDADRFVRAGGWSGWDPWGFLGVPVAGKTLGIVGMGKIGSAVARRSRGFSMKVLYHNRRRIPPPEEVRARGVVSGPRRPSRRERLRRAVRSPHPGDPGADLPGTSREDETDGGPREHLPGRCGERRGVGVGVGGRAAVRGGARRVREGAADSPEAAVGPIGGAPAAPRERDRGDAGGDGEAGDGQPSRGARRAGAAVPRQLKPIPFRRRMSMGSIVPVLEKGIRTTPTNGATIPTEPLNS